MPSTGFLHSGELNRGDALPQLVVAHNHPFRSRQMNSAPCRDRFCRAALITAAYWPWLVRPVSVRCALALATL